MRECDRSNQSRSGSSRVGGAEILRGAEKLIGTLRERSGARRAAVRSEPASGGPRANEE